jgi:lipoprotein NlpD
MPLCQPDRGERMGKINSPLASVVLILLALSLIVSCYKPQIQKNQTSGVYHLLKKGETVQMIAQAYSIRLQDLVRANNLIDVKSVKAGSVIFIPYATRVIDNINVKTAQPAANVSAWKYSSGNARDPAKYKEVKENKEVKEANTITESPAVVYEKDVISPVQNPKIQASKTTVPEEEVPTLTLPDRKYSDKKTESEKNKENKEVKKVNAITETPAVAKETEVMPPVQNPKTQPSKTTVREEATPALNLPDKKYSNKKTESNSGTQKTVEKETIKVDKNRFIWPIRGSVKTNFGLQSDKTYYNWIKIVSTSGTKVKAAANGTIIFSSYLKNYGETIIIRHKDNYATVYTHLKKRYVRIDKDVKKGETIAMLGEKDDTGQTYMNFEIRLRGKARNPMLFLP